MSVKIALGTKKKSFPSIKAAYEAAKVKNPDLKYITFYMRTRKLGMKPVTAFNRPVRKYEYKQAVAA